MISDCVYKWLMRVVVAANPCVIKRDQITEKINIHMYNIKTIIYIPIKTCVCSVQQKEVLNPEITTRTVPSWERDTLVTNRGFMRIWRSYL